jgi:hypothetical protein
MEDSPMKQQSVVVVLCMGLATLAVVTPSVVAQAGITWSPEIHLDNLASLSQRLAAPEDPDATDALTLHDDAELQTKTAISCNDYLNAENDGFRAHSKAEASLQFPFIGDCYTLRDLGSVRVPTNNYLPVWDAGLINNLPPILQSGEQYPESHEPPPLTWSGAVTDLIVTDTAADSLTAEDYSSRYALQLLATGDLNGDGVADMVVAGNVSAKGGTASRRDYMVFTRCGSSSAMIRLTAEQPPFKLGTTRCQ